MLPISRFSGSPIEDPLSFAGSPIEVPLPPWNSPSVLDSPPPTAFASSLSDSPPPTAFTSSLSGRVTSGSIPPEVSWTPFPIDNAPPAGARRPKIRPTIIIEDPVVGEITNKEPSMQVLLYDEEKADFRWIDSVGKAIEKGSIFPAPKGKNGAFWVLEGRGKPIAVLKPQEHELGAPKCVVRNTEVCCAKRGIQPGEGARTEYLAWEIAQKFGGLLGVPDTIYAQVVSSQFIPGEIGLSNEKHVLRYCSIQRFVPDFKEFHLCSRDEKESLSIGDVQVVALFDMMMFNTDRNPDNLGVSREGLYVYDHGCCLPRYAESPAVFCWQELPQVLEPVEPIFIEWVSRLPQRGFADSKTFESIDEGRKETHILAIQLLKQGIEEELSLYEIASFCTQQDAFDQSVARWIMQRKLMINGDLSLLVTEAIEEYKSLLLIQKGPWLKDACDAAMEELRGIYAGNIRAAEPKSKKLSKRCSIQ